MAKWEASPKELRSLEDLSGDMDLDGSISVCKNKDMRVRLKMYLQKENSGPRNGYNGYHGYNTHD
jgi:hypothetical protein